MYLWTALSFPPPMDTGCFNIPSNINNTVVNPVVQVSLQGSGSASFGCSPRSTPARSFTFDFLEGPRCRSHVAAPFAVPPTARQVPLRHVFSSICRLVSF